MSYTTYAAASQNIGYATPGQLPNINPTTPGTPTPAGRGRPRGSAPGTGAKRGRKPRGASTLGTNAPRTAADIVANASLGTQYPRVQWALPKSQSGDPSAMSPGGAESPGGSGSGTVSGQAVATVPQGQAEQNAFVSGYTASSPGGAGPSSSSTTTGINYNVPGVSTPVPPYDPNLIGFSGTIQPPPVSNAHLHPRPHGIDEDGEGDDELLPAMADDDYSAQLSWQSQSKDNLKVLMDNFSPGQYDRFEAYRRHALPKQAVRKVIQQTLGQQVSQPVAQVIAGFSKVFVGEVVEKARAVQARRGETGPLSPDHLREAYRAYQEETGRVGAARPLRAKKYFVR